MGFRSSHNAIAERAGSASWALEAHLAWWTHEIADPMRDITQARRGTTLDATGEAAACGRARGAAAVQMRDLIRRVRSVAVEVGFNAWHCLAADRRDSTRRCSPAAGSADLMHASREVALHAGDGRPPSAP